MEKILILSQIVIASSVFIVWIFRNDNITKEFQQYNLSSLTKNLVGAIKISISTVLILAIWYPELLFVSAGFDAHALDPLAGLNLQDSDYGWVTTKLMEIADKSTNGRLISALEGGYDLAALSSSVASHVEELVKA